MFSKVKQFLSNTQKKIKINIPIVFYLNVSFFFLIILLYFWLFSAADEDLEYIVRTSWNLKTLRVVVGKSLQDCGLIYSVQRLPLKAFQTILELSKRRTRNLIICDRTFWNPKSAIVVSFNSHCYILTNYNSVEEVISLLADRFSRLKQLFVSCNITRSTFVNSLLKMNTQLEEFTFALECNMTISIDLTLIPKTMHSLSLKFIDLNKRESLEEVSI